MYIYIHIHTHTHTHTHIYIYIYIYIYDIYIYIYIYPLCGETLEPLARFVGKLPKDLNLSEDGFPGDESWNLQNP